MAGFFRPESDFLQKFRSSQSVHSPLQAGDLKKVKEYLAELISKLAILPGSGWQIQVLGCPVGSDRIKGDRISGLFHPNKNPIYKDRWNNPLIRSPLILTTLFEWIEQGYYHPQTMHLMSLPPSSRRTGNKYNTRLCTWATKKNLLLSIESWLVNRDPYNCLL